MVKITASAPCRIGLLGGGTDIPTYSNLYGGLCLNMAISLRQEVEINDTGVLDLDSNDNHDFFEAFCDPKHGVKHRTNGISEAGLGSSAALAVALVGAYDKLNNTNLSMGEIAERAWDLEVNKLNMFGGKQDQYCAAIGGVNVMEFDDEVKITPLSTNFIDPLLPCLVLFHTGENRKSSILQEGFLKLTARQKDSLDKIRAGAFVGIEHLLKHDVEGFGFVMDEMWEAKKDSNKGVTNVHIDRIYLEAKRLGAWGGKICGAGGGGFFLVVCPPNKRSKIIKELGIRHVPFSVEWEGLKTW